MLKPVPYILFFFNALLIHAQHRPLHISGSFHEPDGKAPDHYLRLLILRNNDTIINQLCDSLFAFHITINYDPKDTVPLIIKPQETDLEKLKPYATGPCPWNHFSQYAFFEYSIEPGYTKDTFFVSGTLLPWLEDFNYAPSIYFYNNSCDMILNASDSLGKININKINCFTSLPFQKMEVRLITYAMDNSRRGRKMALCRGRVLRDHFVKKGMDKNKMEIILRNYSKTYPNDIAQNNTFIMLQFSRGKM